MLRRFGGRRGRGAAVGRGPATVVLVHGAWQGAWAWAQVAAGLDDAGVPAVPVDLPGHGASTEPLGDLHGDADHVREVLDVVGARGRRVVLVGHSLGGAVVTDAGTHPSVERLVFVAGYAPDRGESVAELAAGQTGDLREAVRSDDGGATTTLDPGVARDLLYHDCAPTDAERALGLHGPQATAVVLQPVRAAAWRERPSTYVLCGADRVVPPPLQQRMAGRIPDADVLVWDTAGHCPTVARPRELAELLTTLATE